MMKKTILLCVLVYSCSANGSEICTFTEQEKEYFDFTEHYPFTDKQFSPKSAKAAQEVLEADKEGKKVKNYIPVNIMNVIEGSRLQKEMLIAEKELNSYFKNDAGMWDKKHYKLKYRFLQARKDYCDFQRSHYVIDW